MASAAVPIRGARPEEAMTEIAIDERLRELIEARGYGRDAAE